MNSGLDAVEYALARRAMAAQASVVVDVGLGFFDPDRLEEQLSRDLPNTLRALAAGIDAGVIEGRLMNWSAGGGADDRVHMRVTLGLAASVRQSLPVEGLEAVEG